MHRASVFLESTAHEIARASARLGERVLLDASILDRSDSVPLSPPGRQSANGACRLISARDGWIAANLPRTDDLEAIPALLEEAPGGDIWAMLELRTPRHSCASLVGRAKLLGLAIARVAETAAPELPCSILRVGESQRTGKPLRVIDFSTLWAGPLCGSIFAGMGAEVLKLDTTERPDPTPHTAPVLDRRLNGRKTRQSMPIAEAGRTLNDLIARSDILITSARTRALDALRIDQARVFARNPSLIWIAITGHGRKSSRIAFGDDAAAAGGLLDWREGAPHFIGDAIADPLTGMAAAASALAMRERGESGMIDASLSHVAAYVAAQG